jgi:hypothetical protein
MGPRPWSGRRARCGVALPSAPSSQLPPSHSAPRLASRGPVRPRPLATRPSPRGSAPQGGGCGGLFDIMLTTYTLWERESTAYSIDRSFLSRWPWSHVVRRAARSRPPPHHHEWP